MQYGKIDISAVGPGFGVTYFEGIVDTTVVVSGTPIDGDRVHQRMSFMIKKRESEEHRGRACRLGYHARSLLRRSSPEFPW